MSNLAMMPDPAEPVSGAPSSTDYATLVAEIDALRAANALLKTYAYTAAHELAGPARRLVMHLDLLEASTKATARSARLAKVKDSATALTNLVTELLDVAALDFRGFADEEVELASLVDSVFSEATSVIPDVSVSVGTMGNVFANATLLRRLLSNVADNAVKFRRPEVPLVIAVGATTSGEGSTIISVTDNGIGIDPTRASSIFEPLVRLHGKSEYAGTGIGLALALRIAQWFGGTMEAVPNMSGCGATIKITIESPATPRTAREPHTGRSSAETGSSD